jgi:hypothetical protein
VTVLGSHLNIHKRVTSERENFNNQVGKMNISLNTTQPLSQLLLSFPIEIMNKLALLADVEFIQRISNMHFHSTRPV